jgi:membrane-associated phospholipid phosphatase
MTSVEAVLVKGPLLFPSYLGMTIFGVFHPVLKVNLNPREHFLLCREVLAQAQTLPHRLTLSFNGFPSTHPAFWISSSWLSLPLYPPGDSEGEGSSVSFLSKPPVQLH